jgi:hypothetical protein
MACRLDLRGTSRADLAHAVAVRRRRLSRRLSARYHARAECVMKDQLPCPLRARCGGQRGATTVNDDDGDRQVTCKEQVDGPPSTADRQFLTRVTLGRLGRDRAVKRHPTTTDIDQRQPTIRAAQKRRERCRPGGRRTSRPVRRVLSFITNQPVSRPAGLA